MAIRGSVVPWWGAVVPWWGAVVPCGGAVVPWWGSGGPLVGEFEKSTGLSSYKQLNAHGGLRIRSFFAVRVNKPDKENSEWHKNEKLVCAMRTRSLRA